ncbi:hypothetical protein D3C75_987350 [compost metagenome]
MFQEIIENSGMDMEVAIHVTYEAMRRADGIIFRDYTALTKKINGMNNTPIHGRIKISAWVLV